MVDRNPAPGMALHPEAAMLTLSSTSPKLIWGRDKYPGPPVGLLFDPDVDLMFSRFCLYRMGRSSRIRRIASSLG